MPGPQTMPPGPGAWRCARRPKSGRFISTSPSKPYGRIRRRCDGHCSGVAQTHFQFLLEKARDLFGDLGDLRATAPLDSTRTTGSVPENRTNTAPAPSTGLALGDQLGVAGELLQILLGADARVRSKPAARLPWVFQFRQGLSAVRIDGQTLSAATQPSRSSE